MRLGVRFAAEAECVSDMDVQQVGPVGPRVLRLLWTHHVGKEAIQGSCEAHAQTQKHSTIV